MLYKWGLGIGSSPYETLALVRSMVRDGGIRQQDIILCEPSRAITDSIYNKVHREFPEIGRAHV